MLSIEVCKSDLEELRVLAVDGGEVVGSAFGGWVGSMVGLDTIQVNPPTRGDGIGKMLVGAFVNLARSIGANGVVGEVKPEFGLRVNEVRQMYRDLGFRVGEDGTLEMNF